MKRVVTVHIAGARYQLRSDGDDDTVKRLAAQVDARIKDIQKQTRTADTQALAILAALQIAEELHEAREAHATLKKKIRDKGRAIIAMLEREARV